MEKVKWYRNSSEKDKDNVKGRGMLMAISPRRNNAGGSAVIADEAGNIVEKELSLIKLDDGPSIDSIALQNELDKTIEANKKLSDDLSALNDEKTKLVNEVTDLTADKKSLEDLYHDKVTDYDKLAVEVKSLKAKAKVKPVKN